MEAAREEIGNQTRGAAIEFQTVSEGINIMLFAGL